MACGDVTADMLRWFMQYLATQQVTAIDIFNFQLSAFCAMTSNMESEHASKRIKLEQLLQFKAKLPAHSQSALEAILQEASKSGIPDLVSSNHQREARLQLLGDYHGGSLGPLIQQSTLELEDGSTAPMYYTNLLVYMANLYHKNTSFTKLIQECHRRSPSTIDQPWGLCLYCDEMIPGNILGRAERKTWCIYSTIDAFGIHMHQEDSWLTLAVERSSFVSTVNGGISQMVATILTSIFCCPIANPKVGFTLKSSTGDVTIFLNFKMMLCDGAAHKQVWASKGDSGQKFCLMCSNVRSHPPKQDQDQEEAYTQPLKYHELQLVQDEELLASYQRMAVRHGTCSKQDFATWQVATGITFSKHALLLNAKLLAAQVLKPISQFCHDWMHGVLQGTAPIVLYHTLEAIFAHMDIYNFLEEYFQRFQFPKAWKASHVHSLFTKKKVEKFRKANKFSCLASEILAIYPIVRHLIHVHLEPRKLCPEACQAFCTMAEIIDQCHGGTQWKVTTRASLLEAIEAGNQAFAHAFPTVGMIKKWHWHLHLPDSYARYGHLPSCFTCERKHKTISSFATRLQHTQGYEINLLQQVVSNEIMALQQENVFPNAATLVKPKKATQKQKDIISIFLLGPCEDAFSSMCARLAQGGQIFNEDVIIYQKGSEWRIAQVQFHVQICGTQATLVQVWEIQEYHLDKQYVKCNVSSQYGFISLSSILFPVTFAKGNDGAKVLLPYPLYAKASKS